ncbi:hypothetical protein Tco_0606559, partial [Tanacetum coccineum]
CKRKKHATLAKSSTEVEYKAMASATCEVMCIWKVLKDLNVDNVVPVRERGMWGHLKFDSKNQVAKILTKASGSV